MRWVRRPSELLPPSWEAPAASSALKDSSADSAYITSTSQFCRSLDDMPPPSQPIQFAQFVVTTQVFYTTKLSAALVNLKPILPGHSLVIPRRVVPRYTDLLPDEVQY